MRILVTGANGQLGNEMQVLAKENPQHIYFFTDVRELDICDEQAVRAFVTENEIDVIVNCAAYTAVDNAEDNRELCDKLNHVAPGYLARAAQSRGAAIIQVSTDYVSMEQLTSLTMKTNLLVRLPYMVSPSWRESRLLPKDARRRL